MAISILPEETTESFLSLGALIGSRTEAPEREKTEKG